MSIWKKISDLARTNLNELLHQLEDPKKLAEQAILDMEQKRQLAHQLLIKAMASVKMATLKHNNLQHQITELLEQATNYLRQGREDKAKEILSEKYQIEQEELRFRQELIKEQDYIAALHRGIKTLEHKISEFKSSASIKASTEYLEKEDAFQTFARMEEKIDNSEHELAALQELIKEGQAKEEAPTHIPQAPFDQHSDPHALEAELVALKKKLNDS